MRRNWRYICYQQDKRNYDINYQPISQVILLKILIQNNMRSLKTNSKPSWLIYIYESRLTPMAKTVHKIVIHWDDSHLNVMRPEQKLSIQVWFLNKVHICNNDFSFWTASYPHHGEVLQHFATNGTRAYLWKKSLSYYFIWCWLDVVITIFNPKFFLILKRWSKPIPFTSSK